MSVGNQPNKGSTDMQISQLAIQLRNIMQAISNLSVNVNGQSAGLATLEAWGYSSAANPANPGGISDAQYALNMIGYLNTVSGVYYGTATQTPAFNFDQELSQVWGGQ